VFVGSSPITFTSPSSKAHQKSGSFPLPALPGFNGRMTLSDSRQCRRLEATLRPLPSHRTDLPRLPESPFRRAEPTTPADRAGAHVDCFPRSRSLPQMAGGSASAVSLSRPAQASLTLRPAGSLSRPQATFCHEAPTHAVTRISYRINRQLSGWILPPLMIRAFGAHCQQRTYAPQQKAPVAVGTCVSSHAPRPDPYVRLSRIRRPPRVYDGERCRIRSSALVTRAWR
jgi:hypothetical protein